MTLAAVITDLEKILANLKSLNSPPKAELDAIDPKDPRNKYEVGGLMKLTPQGEEVCYRLFDKGKTRYAVATAMDLSFGAASHRQKVWAKLGGVNRKRS
jgi:hypothetical protein